MTTSDNGKPPGYHEAVQAVLNRLTGTFNAASLRSDFLKRMLDPRRNVYEEAGYPTSNPVAEFYQDLWEREAVAARVVELYAKESWKLRPTVYESEDGDEATEFEAAFDALENGLRGEKSWVKGNENSLLWSHVQQADVLSGIGHYGVLLLGLNDGKPLDKPAERRAYSPGKGGPKLRYLQAFPEALAPISSTDDDRTSPRYGKPLTYTLTFNDPRDGQTAAGPTTATQQVHWTRVVHLADVHHTAASSNVYAVPRMRPVLNHLLGLQKIDCADPEGYWKSAFQLLFYETHPQLGGDVQVNKQEMRDLFEQLMNGLQRYGMFMGGTLKSIAPAVADPTPHSNNLVEKICVKLGCPVPVFKGYEIGEQASENNSTDWAERVHERRTGYLSPRAIAPLTDRLIWLGVLPEPADGYRVDWPAVNEMRPTEKAAVAYQTMQTLALYVSGNVASVFPEHEMLTQILGKTDEEATAILDAATDRADDPPAFVPEPPPEPEPPQPGQGKGPPGSPTNPGQQPPPTENRKGNGGNNPKGCNQHTGPGCGVPGVAAKKAGPKTTAAAYAGASKLTLKRENVYADETETSQSRKLMQRKVKAAPVPSADEVAKARAELKLAAEGKIRAGGVAQQNAATVRRQRLALFLEFGGGDRGYVVCPHTGIKMHHTDDPAENPNGYPKFERGKIFTKCQGGGYKDIRNLIPESFEANRSRNDERVRKENSDGC